MGLTSVEILRRQYFQTIDPGLLDLPAISDLKLAETQDAIYQCMFGQNAQYLPPERYQLRVLKRLTIVIEESINDPEVDVCIARAEFVQSVYQILTQTARAGSGNIR